MDNTSLRYVFDRLNKATADTPGLLQIEIRITGTNIKALRSTQIRLFKHQFSSKNGFTCVKHKKAAMITAKARRIYNDLEAFATSSKCRQLSDILMPDKATPNTESVPLAYRRKLRFQQERQYCITQ